jgi:hypothetical protein
LGGVAAEFVQPVVGDSDLEVGGDEHVGSFGGWADPTADPSVRLISEVGH